MIERFFFPYRPGSVKELMRWAVVLFRPCIISTNRKSPPVVISRRVGQQVNMIGHYDRSEQFRSRVVLPQAVFQDETGCFILARPAGLPVQKVKKRREVRSIFGSVGDGGDIGTWGIDEMLIDSRNLLTLQQIGFLVCDG